MRLATVLALSLVLANANVVGAADQKANKDYISKLRIGGWIGNDALLVLPDRSAGAAPIGGGFGGVKMLEIGNTSFTVDCSGQQGKCTLDPVWQLAPHPDLTNWLADFMKDVGLRIDAHFPDTTKEGVIRISHSGYSSSSFMSVQKSAPFQSLPEWMESIDLKVSINPGDPTKVQFVSMTVAAQAYDRLCKSMYSVPAAKAAQ